MDGIQALREIKKGNIGPVYLLGGTNAFIKERIMEELKKNILEEEMSSFNLDTYQGNKQSLGEILSRAETPPVLSRKRMVIVKEVPYFKEEINEKDTEKLINYLENPSPSTCLVLVTDKIDKRKKTTKKLFLKKWVIECNPVKESDLKKWINQKLRQEKKEIKENALELLVKLVGNDLNQMENEISKLCTYLGEDKVLTEDTVRALVSASSLEVSIFSLVDNIGKKNKKEALVQLHSILKQNEPPLKILTMIGRQFRLLIQVKKHLESTKTKRELSSDMKLPAFVVNKLADQAEKFTQEELHKALIRTHETDIKIKTGILEPHFSLELLIAALM